MLPSKLFSLFAPTAVAEESLSDTDRLLVEIAVLIIFAMALSLMMWGTSPESFGTDRTSGPSLLDSLLFGVFVYMVEENMAMARHRQEALADE